MWVYSETGCYGTSENGFVELDALQQVIRDIPKPVIAAVDGVTIGGGYVLHVLCDVSIAEEHAKCGQAGPRVGSFDAGWGTALLARTISEKRAREIWYWCRQYSALQAYEWGLVNKEVPTGQAVLEAKAWVAEVAVMSPTALKELKASFNADTAHIFGQVKMAYLQLEMWGTADEVMEGKQPFVEKRKPNFTPFR